MDSPVVGPESEIDEEMDIGDRSLRGLYKEDALVRLDGLCKWKQKRNIGEYLGKKELGSRKDEILHSHASK
jgi:hypothetical protein